MSVVIQLRDLKPMALGRTHSSKKYYYILLKKKGQFFTVFTTENDGMIMTCETKEIKLDLLFEPANECDDLVNCKYPEEYDRYRNQAICCLINPKKELQPQAKEVLFKTEENLLNEILELHEKARTATPERKEVISSYIERGAIAQKIKRLVNFRCLVCEGLGMETLTFKKRNSNELYIETHHIEHIAELKRGSLALDNLITVCAHHHRQFHFGDLRIIEQTDVDYFYFEIDGYMFKTHKIKIGYKS